MLLTDNEILNNCSNFTMTSKDRQLQILQCVEDICNKNVPGDFIEIGVWKGGIIMIMLYKLLQLGVTDRIIHVYDTFSGMTESSLKDIDRFGIVADYKAPGIICSASYEDVYNNIQSIGYPMKNIIFHLGDIRNTDVSCIPNKIALLRLDIDWYELYKFALPLFEPNVSNDGIVTIDDYNFWNGCKEAVDEYIENKDIELKIIDDCGVYYVKK